MKTRAANSNKRKPLKLKNSDNNLTTVNMIMLETVAGSTVDMSLLRLMSKNFLAILTLIGSEMYIATTTEISIISSPHHTEINAALIVEIT